MLGFTIQDRTARVRTVLVIHAPLSTQVFLGTSPKQFHIFCVFQPTSPFVSSEVEHARPVRSRLRLIRIGASNTVSLGRNSLHPRNLSIRLARKSNTSCLMGWRRYVPFSPSTTLGEIHSPPSIYSAYERRLGRDRLRGEFSRNQNRGPRRSFQIPRWPYRPHIPNLQQYRRRCRRSCHPEPAQLSPMEETKSASELQTRQLG